MKDIIGELKQIALNAIFRLEEADSPEITDRKQFILGLRSAANVIINMPQPDVVGVVRCEDCAHYRTSQWCYSGSDIYRFCPEMGRYMAISDYCSYGDRKDD